MNLRKLAEAKALAEEQELDEPILEEAPKEETATPGAVQEMVESLTEVVEGGPVVSEQLSVPDTAQEVKEEVSNSKAIQDLVGSLIEEEAVTTDESAKSSSIEEDILEKEAKEKQVLLEKVRQKEAELLASERKRTSST